MRKLAVIVDTFPRWSERFIARELRELLRRGVDFTVFCLKAGKLLPNDDDWRGLLERRVVLPSGLVPAGFHGLAPEARSRWKEARRLFGVSGYRHLARAAALRKHLLKGGFGHVHAHFANLPSTLGWLASADAKLPFSLSVHARDLFLEAQLLEQKLADCVRVFTCHVRAQEFLAARTAHRDKVRLMRHGLMLEQFRMRRSQQGMWILAAGRFVPKKGGDVLIEAVAQPVLAGLGMEVILVGEGPEHDALAARIRTLRLAGKVSLLGPTDRREWQNALSAASLFVAPYRTAPDGDADGVPNVVLEAFALGVPVIGTAAGGLSEILTAETGTIAPQNNPAALAQAIASFVHSPSAALEKTRAARALVERDYDIRKNIEPLMALVSD